jgi:hypothetical protein
MEPMVELTYASVVSRDSVRITFLLAALNNLDVLCADVGNAYINVLCIGKCVCNLAWRGSILDPWSSTRARVT